MCLSVQVYVPCMWPWRLEGGNQIPWCCCDKRLGAAMWVLGSEPRSSGKALNLGMLQVQAILAD